MATGGYRLQLEVVGNVLWLRNGDRYYLFDPDHKVDVYREHGTREVATLSSVEVTQGYWVDKGNWFIFYVEDSFSPALHAIAARSFEDAYEAFIEQEGERGHYVLTEESDPDLWADYVTASETGEADPDYVSYSSHGPVMTESFQGFEVEFHSIENR